MYRSSSLRNFDAKLIEKVGVRDIKGYNEAVAGDPEMEHLPHIVIIIDELADLMLAAKKEIYK